VHSVVSCKNQNSSSNTFNFFIKETAKTALAAVCALITSLRKEKYHRVILCYHRITQQDIGGFEKQMNYLSSECRVVKASEIFTIPFDGCKPVVAITFDDAFVSIFEKAVPVLKKCGLTASIFVPTGSLAQLPKWEMFDNSFDENDIVMSEKQLFELDKHGFELLSHTVSHCHLTQVDDATLMTELSGSKLALEKIVQHKVYGIGYPYGAYDLRVCKAAQEVGYRYGFSIEPVTIDIDTSNNMQIGRIIVTPSDSLFKFKIKVMGGYEIVSTLMAVKKKLKNR